MFSGQGEFSGGCREVGGRGEFGGCGEGSHNRKNLLYGRGKAVVAEGGVILGAGHQVRDMNGMKKKLFP